MELVIKEFTKKEAQTELALLISSSNYLIENIIFLTLPKNRRRGNTWQLILQG